MPLAHRSSNTTCQRDAIETQIAAIDVEGVIVEEMAALRRLVTNGIRRAEKGTSISFEHCCAGSSWDSSLHRRRCAGFPAVQRLGLDFVHSNLCTFLAAW
jgi:hypothetical protein